MAIIHASPMYKTYKELKPKLEEEKEEAVKAGEKKGLFEGIDKGKKIGFIDGKIAGIDKGKQEEKVNMAKKLLKRNVDIDIILETTGFTIEEIKKIQKDMEK